MTGRVKELASAVLLAAFKYKCLSFGVEELPWWLTDVEIERMLQSPPTEFAQQMLDSRPPQTVVDWRPHDFLPEDYF